METLKSYFIGFFLSLGLTLCSFTLVLRHILEGKNLIFCLILLALIQLWVQLTFFLHLNLEANNRWNLSIFISTVGVVLILILGSLWIMQNLDYRHMSPQQLDSYILQTEGFQK